MHIGDLIIRKAEPWDKWSLSQNILHGPGLVLEKKKHTKHISILVVYFAKSKKVSTVAERLVELYTC